MHTFGHDLSAEEIWPRIMLWSLLAVECRDLKRQSTISCRQGIALPEKQIRIATLISLTEETAMEHSDEELRRAIEESFVDAFATLCTATPNAVMRNEGDVILYASGFPNSLLNGVLAAKFSSENMAKRTEETLAYFNRRRLPMTFFVGPCCTPNELDEYLQRRGLVPGWSRPGMARGLSDFEPGKLPTGLEIRPGESLSSLGVCAETFAKGFGTAMTMAALQNASDSGYRVGVLQSSHIAGNVYRRIGFREYCRIGVHFQERKPEGRKRTESSTVR